MLPEARVTTILVITLASQWLLARKAPRSATTVYLLRLWQGASSAAGRRQIQVAVRRQRGRQHHFVDVPVLQPER